MAYLGIEIGGTKLQLAVGPGDGTLPRQWRGRVDRAAGAAGIRAQIAREAPALIAGHNTQAVGIGFGGPVDTASQTVITSHQIDGWDGFPLAAWITDTLGLPCRLANDADSAGLAEATIGAGRGRSPVLYVTVGSGLGGGLIVAGRIHAGTGRGAAEIGHMKVRHPSGWGPLEHVASGWGIESQARARALPQTTVPAIADAARSGDPAAQRVLNDALESLAEALCHAIALVCPAVIVIGGGVSLLGEDLYFAPLRERVERQVFRPFAGCTAIVPAALGEEVVLHGAIALAQALSQSED